MDKIIQLDDTLGSEPTTRPVLLWDKHNRPLREWTSVKTASDASEYIKAVTPTPGKTVVLVLALGSYEFYDLNRNGDGFNEAPYKVGYAPSCGCCQAEDGWIGPKDIIQNNYKSFEEHGRNYMHHINRDPNKAVGDVIKAFWNPNMHRVELLVGIDNKLAPEVVQRISDGEYPAVSMGCKIKYDVCTECGHKAPTRAQYCDHLKYKLRQVGPKGLRYGALNPSPTWFDISWVIRPADETGYMLKKVASNGGSYEVKSSAALGEYVNNVAQKKAAIQKISDMSKVVKGLVLDHKTSPLSEEEAHLIKQYKGAITPALQQQPSFDDDTIKGLSSFNMPEILSTLQSHGVMLSTPEIIKLLANKAAPGIELPQQALDNATDAQEPIMDLLAQNPQILDQLSATHVFDMNQGNVNPEISTKAKNYIEKRATIGEYLSRALVPASLRSVEAPYTDVFTVTDPVTGGVHKTTRGAAIAAHDESAKRQLAKLIGGGALLAGAYKTLSSGLPAVVKPLVAGGTAYLGSKYLAPDYGPQYMTNEGIPISANTEMVLDKSAGMAMPVLGTAALVAGLGYDHERRLRNGEYVGDPHKGLFGRALDTTESFADEHPIALGTALLTAKALANKIKIAVVSEPVTDSILLPNVDIDATAEKIGLCCLGI